MILAEVLKADAIRLATTQAPVPRSLRCIVVFAAEGPTVHRQRRREAAESSLGGLSLINEASTRRQQHCDRAPATCASAR